MKTKRQIKPATHKLSENRRFAAARGWDALSEYLERKKREARRKWPTRGSGPTWRELSSYWEGQYVALVKLQKRIARIVKAHPNNDSATNR